MKSILAILFLFYLVSATPIDSDQKSTVTYLSAQTFDQKLQDSEFLLVEFFRPSCPYCRDFAPVYEKIANELSHISPNVKVSSIDTSVQPLLTKRFEVKYVPTIMLFKKGNQEPVIFSENRDIDTILSWVSKQASPTPIDINQKSAIISLTAKNFDHILQDSEFLLVQFFRTTCPYSREFAPDYEQIANELSRTSPNVKVGSIDTSVQSCLTRRFEVKSVPAIMLFKKGNSTPVIFSGHREIGTIMNWISKETKSETGKIVNKGFLEKIDKRV